MTKALWKSVSELKTPERKLLFGVMLAAILALWFSFKATYSSIVNAQAQRIITQDSIIAQKDRALETQRILMQDKIDQCNERYINTMRDIYQHTEKIISK